MNALVKRNILLNPGPATTSDSVKMAQVVPDICPREKEFIDIMNNIRTDLLKIVTNKPSKYCCVLFCGSGTINMDVCLNSLLPKGKKILIINNGAYSTRAVEICKNYNLSHINLNFSIYDIPNFELIQRTLEESSDIAVVYSTHHETGTGLLNPIREIGALAHKYGALHIVDTTSSFAMIPIDMDHDNIDFCMSSAQKGIMAMTGLSFVIGNEEEIIKSKLYPKRSYYCNLFMQYDSFKKTGEMRFTPPVQTIYAASQALKEYFAEGQEAKLKRHLRVNAAIRKGLQNLGLREVINPEIQSGLVISIYYPNIKNWDFNKVHDYCYQKGFTIYPGKISTNNTFRLCSLGAIDEHDIDNFMITLEEAINICNR